MAVFLRFLLSVCLCLLICSSMKGSAVDERQATESHQTHTIRLRSLLPSSVCNLSTKVSGRKSSLEVVHKHGPCSQLSGDKAKSPSHAEILLEDQSRVKMIHARLSKNYSHGDIKETDAARLPANDARTLGSGNYFVTVGLGSPKKDLSLIFDTGSGLTWTQCKPCKTKCYEQVETIFDPGMSTTYSNISCQSELCNSLASATGYTPDCESSTCVYKIRYGDDSFSTGYFGKETLTLSSSDVFSDFLFGCGQDNEGLFHGVAGLLGLARDQISLVSQTAQKYNNFFSYCLPSSPSSTGHLTFGNAGVPNSVKFTPLSTNSPKATFYGLDITAISVGGQTLSIPPSAFSETGTIIDSGTVITRLPPDVYSTLRSAFRQMMAMYPSAQPQTFLDTCYDLSSYDTVNVPTISFSFNGGVEVSLDVSGILYVISLSEVCLAFAGNSDPSEIAIFGNSQQKTLEVVYDVGGGRVGFAPEGCT